MHKPHTVHPQVYAKCRGRSRVCMLSDVVTPNEWPKPLVVGVTGSIGSGKTTLTKALKVMGFRTVSADAIVAQLLKANGAVIEKIHTKFPHVSTKTSGINKKLLATLVFQNEANRQWLESVLHPYVYLKIEKEIVSALQARMPIAIEIPLLFEAGGSEFCDVIFLTKTLSFLQKNRVLRRPGMTPEVYEGVLSSQIPDREKAKYVDLVIHTGLGLRETLKSMKRFFQQSGWQPK